MTSVQATSDEDQVDGNRFVLPLEFPVSESRTIGLMLADKLRVGLILAAGGDGEGEENELFRRGEKARNPTFSLKVPATLALLLPPRPEDDTPPLPPSSATQQTCNIECDCAQSTIEEHVKTFLSSLDPPLRKVVVKPSGLRYVLQLTQNEGNSAVESVMEERRVFLLHRLLNSKTHPWNIFQILSIARSVIPSGREDGGDCKGGCGSPEDLHERRLHPGSRIPLLCSFSPMAKQT